MERRCFSRPAGQEGPVATSRPSVYAVSSHPLTWSAGLTPVPLRGSRVLVKGYRSCLYGAVPVCSY